MTDKKVDLKRESTMQVTAKEGVKFLKDSGEDTLLELQGLEKGDVVDAKGKPRMKRDSTMAVTAKEGKCFLMGKRSSESTTTAKGSEAEGSASDKGSKSQAKPKMTKFTTMMQTKKEGEAFLAAQEKGEGDLKANEEPANKKAKSAANEKIDNKKPAMKKLTTIKKTVAEGEELLRGLGHKDDSPDSDRRRTRSQTRGGPPPPPSVKKEKKLAKVAMA